MKFNFFHTILILLISLFLGIDEVSGQCGELNSKNIQDLLGESVYDNFRRTEITNSDDPYEIEFRVDLLKNFVYKLVFDMSEKSEGVIIKLYDLGPKKKNELSEPQLLYTSSEDKMDDNAMFDITFEAPKTRMLVKYEVKDATYPGCVTFVLGVFMRDQKPKGKNINLSDFKE